jgi:hypothetical protein
LKRIYIAGALNSDACGYIQNLHQMTDYANEVMSLGCAVYSPGNDFIQGLVSGCMDYTDYVHNTMAFLDVCDAVALVPNTWNKNSIGTRNEIVRARQLSIPVLYTFDEVKSFVL